MRKALGAALAVVLSCGAVLAGGATAAAEDNGTTYDVVALAPGAESSGATGLNSYGAAVGWQSVADTSHAMAWFGRSSVDLGLPVGERTSRAAAINDLNGVVGNASRAARPGEPGELVRHGFQWFPSGQTPQEIPNGAATVQTVAADVSDAGAVVGSWIVSGAVHAYRRDPSGAVTQLAQTTGLANSEALAVNRSGDVAGYAYDFSGPSHAVVWRDGAVIDLGPTVAPGRSSQATDISDTGDVVGTAESSDGAYHGFLWSPDGVLDLGPATQFDQLHVNNRRQVVFSSSDRALWDDGARVDLGTLGPREQGWQLVGGNDINDAGQIVGTGFHDGRSQAFLLLPRSSPTATPTPTTTRTSTPTPTTMRPPRDR